MEEDVLKIRNGYKVRTETANSRTHAVDGANPLTGTVDTKTETT